MKTFAFMQLKAMEMEATSMPPPSSAASSASSPLKQSAAALERVRSLRASEGSAGPEDGRIIVFSSNGSS